MTIAWTTDVEEGRWIVDRLHAFGQDVGSVVPAGYQAYARLFHPVDDQPNNTKRWSDVARRNGRIAHPQMQFHLVSSPAGTPPSDTNHRTTSLRWGSLPRTELAALVGVLGRFTATLQDCWFAVWDGFGQIHGGSALGQLTSTGGGGGAAGIAPPEALLGPRLRLPQREYLVLRGPLADVTDLHDALDDQSPNLWWPMDRSWCVATEIDFAWTYVAGSQRLIAELLTHSALEALPAKISDRFTINSDVLNASFDQ